MSPIGTCSTLARRSFAYMDTLVFDIETQNFFTDPNVGWNNFDALKISVVGIYSYASDKYFCFEEHEMERVGELFGSAARIIGFGMNRYDVPVLHRYLLPFGTRGSTDLWKKERIDLLEEVEMAAGQRISLDKLARANLGTGKTGHGSEAIELYRNREMEKLKTYCLKDVELTKRLYDIYRNKKEFLLPDRKTGEIITVNFPASQDHAYLF